MAWLVALVVLAIVLLVGIWFLHRFYAKANREIALVRTGLGGRKVVLDGGCIALPFLHKVAEVNMRTSRLEVERTGPDSVITSDRLRADVAAEFHVRVQASEEGVATAAQALAGKTFRATDLAETLEGKLVSAVLSVAAGYTMDSLQDERAKYTAAVGAMLADDLAQNGLLLESVSLTRLDQTPFQALDENNAFNALGMRRLAEVIAVNRKERAAIEADAEVAVRRSQLDATKRTLLLTQEEEEATIVQQREIETARTASQADIAEQQSASERRREAARIERERVVRLSEIEREREVRSSEIERDRELRRQQIAAELATETARVDDAVKLAAKRVERAGAEAEVHAARAREADAEERVQTAREAAAAERAKTLALIRAAERAEVDDTRVKSEAGTVVAMAEAEARAAMERAAAEKDGLLARAEGTAALVRAENAHSPELIRLKLDRARIKALPDIVEKMMKPAEKIETIRINHVTGLGAGGGAGGGAEGGGASGGGGAVNQAIDGMLRLALELPAVKKLGEEVGINVGGGVRGLAASLGGDGGADANAGGGGAGAGDGRGTGASREDGGETPADEDGT